MHSLLERQIRKFLPEYLNTEELSLFLEAISKSYTNFDEKSSMVQRAMSISSEELSFANKELRKEAESQKKTLKMLEKAIKSLDSTTNPDISNNKTTNFNPLELPKRIENQAKEIVRMTTEKNILLKDLESQNEALNNYAHMVSHDLKSPIRNINALMTWVIEEEKEKFSKESNYNCELVYQNLAKMDALIDGILRHAMIDAAEGEKVTIDINLLIEEIKNTIYFPDITKINVLNKLPIIKAEKYKLEQLFKNLIVNAISATEHLKKGEITIAVEEENEYWKFIIADNGKGIAEKHQEGIFQMFKKLENNANATGIGLALVKKIVNFHKGEIWLKSIENQGTSFYFTLKK